jgi:hypothetical protein
VAADVVHTLLALAALPAAARGADLYARIGAPSVAGLAPIQARLILLDTPYSTMSEPLAIRPDFYQGTFQLRHLPPGTYRLVVYRVGCQPLFLKPLDLKPGASVREEWNLEAAAPAGNLIRNPDFKIRWSSKDRPEHWQYHQGKSGWVSDNIKIEAGRKYRVVVNPGASADAHVAIEWLRREWPLELGAAIDLPDAETHLISPPLAVYARLLVRGRGQPSASLQSVALMAE